MHTIRLRGPWEKRATTDGSWRRVRVPETGMETEVATDEMPKTEVTYRRRFNLPSGLGPKTSVFLEIARQTGHLVEVRINQVQLASESRQNLDAATTDVTRYDVRDKLSAHNLVEIELVSETADRPRLSGDVRLLIIES